jgi:hypothetical protein
MITLPQGVQGGISDGWQITIHGSEAPGTYLVLAPGQKEPDDVQLLCRAPLADLNISSARVSLTKTQRARSGRSRS